LTIEDAKSLAGKIEVKLVNLEASQYQVQQGGLPEIKLIRWRFFYYKM